MMITAFNLVVLLLAVTLMGIVLLRNKRVDTILVLAVLLISLNCFGRYLQAVTQDFETAIIANGLIYVGSCYVPLLMVYFFKRFMWSKTAKMVPDWIDSLFHGCIWLCIDCRISALVLQPGGTGNCKRL